MPFELCHPKTKVIFGDNNQYDKRKSWRLFNAKSHRTRVTLVSTEDLATALIDWEPSDEITYMAEMPVKFQADESELWISRGLCLGENVSDYELVLLHAQENGWNKMALRTKTKNPHYLFRSFVSRNPTEYKTLERSLDEGWFVDKASLEADKSFWENLKKTL